MSLSREKIAPRAPAPAGLVIRPFSGGDADYAAAVDVVNAVFPEYPDTVDEWRFGDANRPAHIKMERWLAELDGATVAYGNYHQFEGMYHPRKFGVFIAVLPALQGRGVGAALYDHVVAALDRHGPISLRARAREDAARSLRFLAGRGYREDMREWESRLDVAAFDPAPYAGHEAALRADGLRIAPLAELLERDPDCREKLWALDVELTRDVPHPEPITATTRESFEAWIFNNPNFLPDGYFVALDGPDYVGSSALWRSQADSGELYTGLTGVRRAYRRRGIALALKLRDIAYAREHGVRVIKTWNEANNRGMLSINEALGFVKQPAWITFVKQL
ncbi:GNAT family N-acetyltransferase [Oscillochloris sp. ZM17-4]|uniref:GNAT family N-acetyltransferase n=1 Tax=Oscillochloris sp. ZM17-4 TaxID=2866714 RepID=UPI001C732487|nr:GNAT family N-acetyltransferase [Oscillochloris sp. ZM17-4]MBX0327418.1 GNAT family N-acetyltransferase [Oscillochloris sp. ZM17-4]